MSSSRPSERPLCPACHAAAGAFYPSHLPGSPWMFHCKECGLGFVFPVPSSEQLSAMYDDSYTASAETTEACRRVAPIYFRKIAPFLPAKKEFRFLEVGGSYGFLPALVHARTGASATLLEPGATAVKAAAAAFPIEAVQGYTETYTPSVPFDVLFAAHVVEHVPDLEQFFASCHRLVCPGGTLLLLTPNASSWKFERFGQAWSWAAPGEHTHLLTAKSARLLLERAGYEVIALKASIPDVRQYPFFLTRSLSAWLTRLIGRAPVVDDVSLPDATDMAAVSSTLSSSPKRGWKYYLRRSGRVILWAEYFSLSLFDRAVGLGKADELLIVARRKL